MKTNIAFSLGLVLINTLFPILIFPYITRVFSVADLGNYNYYNIIFVYLGILANFGLNLLGSKEIGGYKNRPLRQKVVFNRLFFTGLKNTFIVLFFYYLISLLFLDQDFNLIILTLSTLVISNTISSEWYFVGTENQKYIFFRSLTIKSISVMLIYLLVINENDLILYATIVAGGAFLNAFLNIINLRHLISFKYFFGSFKSYRSLISIFLIEMSFRYFGLGDVAILGNYATDEYLGFFTFALSIYAIGSSFLKVIATTLLPKAAYYLTNNDNNNFDLLAKQSVTYISFIWFCCVIVIALLSRNIVTILGGEKYLYSSELLLSFIPLIVLSSILNVIIFQVLYPLGKTKQIITSLVFGISINILLNLTLIHLIPKYSFIISASFSALTIVFYLIINKSTRFVLKYFDRKLFKYFIAMLACYLLFYLLNQFNLYPIINVYASTFIFTTVFIVLSFILKDPVIHPLLKKQNVKKS